MRPALILPALLAYAALAACDNSSPAPAPQPSKAAAVAPPVDSHDPRKVLLGWAKAISLRNWDEAYGYWGEQGARSGMTRAEHFALWDKLAQPELEIHEGKAEGAAGSLFYSAPVVLIDGSRKNAGEVVLRKVNQVPGATPEQLRWHIERMTLQP